MLKKIEAYTVALIQGKKRGVFAWFFKLFLMVLSWPYQMLMGFRNWAFDHGCFKLYYAPVPVVISVGNIVVGGTGKTPVTLMLAEEFYKEFLIAILSRGYRSKAEHLPSPTMISRGGGPIHPASFCGDEPYLLSNNLPKALVFVGKNRHDASNMAARAGAQLILLDDGMQHRHLARDFEVVVLDALDPFGQGYFLPRGFLRESVSSLARADLIVLNHVHDHERYEFLKKEIKMLTEAPLIATKMNPEGVFDVLDRKVDSLKDKKVGIFCAIAHPEYFMQTVKNMDAEIVDTFFIPDHMAFSDKELLKFHEKCKALGAEWIVCTEKDWVKLNKSVLKDLPFAWLKMRLLIIDGQASWNKFTEKAKKDIKRRM